MKTYVCIKILKKSGLWTVLYGLATIFAVTARLHSLQFLAGA
jgi:hypothetical protein